MTDTTPLAAVPVDWKGPVVRFLEKVGVTYLQALVLTLMASGWFDQTTTGVPDLAFLTSMAVATLPVAFTVISNKLLEVPLVGMPFWLALAVRILQSAVAGAAGYVASIPLFGFEASIGKAALAAAGMAVLAFLKGEGAKFVGQKGTPALVPKRYDVGASTLALTGG